MSVWIVNRFGDLFLKFDDGSINMLDVGRGSVTRLADDRDKFATLLDDGDSANDWLMIPLVDRLVSAGLTLRPGDCYSYARPPILGGDYTIENTRVVSLAEHHNAFGPIQEKLRDVPDGTWVKFEAGNNEFAADEAGASAAASPLNSVLDGRGVQEGP